MTRFKKIRGHRKKWKEIAEWVDHYKSMDIDYYKSSQRDYVKVWVHPWSGISITNSQIQEPKGKTRQLIIEGLLTIYEAWKVQLDQLNRPYYLKIWLHEPHISRSQVVCATGDMLTFYDHTFNKAETSKQLKTCNYGVLTSRIQALNWELHKEEFHFSADDIGEPDEYISVAEYRKNKKYLERLMKHPNITTYSDEQAEEHSRLYFHQIGNVWIGGS